MTRDRTPAMHTDVIGWQGNVPITAATAVGDQVRFFCQHCGEVHIQGRGDGHRAAHPNFRRVVLTDMNAEPGVVVVTIGFRGVCTGEVEVRAERFDAMVLLALLNTAGGAVGGNQVSNKPLNERSNT